MNCFSHGDFESCNEAMACVWDGRACSSVCVVMTFQRPIAGSLQDPYEMIENTDAASCEQHCIMDKSCSQYLYYSEQRTCWLHGSYTEELESMYGAITGNAYPMKKIVKTFAFQKMLLNINQDFRTEFADYDLL